MSIKLWTVALISSIVSSYLLCQNNKKLNPLVQTTDFDPSTLTVSLILIIILSVIFHFLFSHVIWPFLLYTLVIFRWIFCLRNAIPLRNVADQLLSRPPSEDTDDDDDDEDYFNLDRFCDDYFSKIFLYTFTFAIIFASAWIFGSIWFTRPPCILGIAQEQYSPDFLDNFTASLTKLIHDFAFGLHQELPQRPCLRAQHGKNVGCLKGTFTILPIKNESLRQGIFAREGMKFPAWIRFSHSSERIVPDSTLGAKGMAIKLLNVNGNRTIFKEENHTQDFLLLSSPVFFSNSITSYQNFIQQFPNIIPSFVLSNLADPSMYQTMYAISQITSHSQKLVNPLYWNWYSTTPYKLGSTYAVKYVLTPCEEKKVNSSEEVLNDTNYMRTSINKTLSKESVCFKFHIQVQQDPCSQPLEDPTLEWKTPLIEVAKLEIPKQEFLFGDQFKFCEHISFNPWHSLDEHSPLGFINYQRRKVYSDATHDRIRWNYESGHAFRKGYYEPNGSETFSQPLPEDFENRSKLSAGDTTEFQFQSYDPPFEGLPHHSKYSNAVDTKFSGRKMLRILTRVYEGLDNGIRELLSSEYVNNITTPDSYLRMFLNSGVMTRVPEIARNGKWKYDSAFAMQFIRGVNPVTIQVLNSSISLNFQLTKKHNETIREILSGYPYKTLQELIDHNLTFYADYSLLHPFIMQYKREGGLGSLYPALIVLYLHRDASNTRLMPLFIKLNATIPSSDDLFFPPTPKIYARSDWDQSPEWLQWLFARMHVASADGHVHEMISHLGLTHLMVEPIIVSTYRNFKRTDTIFKLLKPHMRQTIAINTLGRLTLLNPGGFFDSITCLGTRGTLGLIQQYWKEHLFSDRIFPLELQRRGFNYVEEQYQDTVNDTLPGYVYRDFGFLIWNALKKYVVSIISKQYKTDMDVVSDKNLQYWAKEIAHPEYGGLPGFPKKFTTISQLVDILTHFIFTVSAQHSAVNFGQFDFYGFIPNRPLALAKPMPENKNVTMEWIMKALPSETKSLDQITITNILSMSPTTVLDLGDDEKMLYLGKLLQEWYMDEPQWRPEFNFEWNELITDLRITQAKMKKRNFEGGYNYPYLFYDQISMSIAI